MFLVQVKRQYSKNKPDELDLHVGDIIEVKETEFDSWWVGKDTKTGDVGWFPSNFVEKFERAPAAPRERPKRKFKNAIVLFDYDSDVKEDLKLEKGSVVEILEEFDSWYLGRQGSNIGTFPSDLVRIMSPEEELMYKSPELDYRKSTMAPHGSHESPPVLPSRGPPSLPHRDTTPDQSYASLEHPKSPSFKQPGRGSVSFEQSRPLPQVPDPRTKGSRNDTSSSTNTTQHKESKVSTRLNRLFGSKKEKRKSKIEATSYEDVPTEIVGRKSITNDSTNLTGPPNTSLPPPPPSLPHIPLSSPKHNSQFTPPPPHAPPPHAPPPHVPPPSIPSPHVPPPSIPSPHAPPKVPPPIYRTLSKEIYESQKDDLETRNADHHVDETSEKKNNLSNSEEASGTTHDTKGEEAPHKDESKYDVQEEENIEVHEATKKVTRGQPKLARILEDYESDLPEELYLDSGDVVEIIHMGTNNDSRWKGNYHGKIGYFPANVVEPIPESGDIIEDTENSVDEKREQSKEETSGEKSNVENEDNAKMVEGDKAESLKSTLQNKTPPYGIKKGGVGSLFAGSDGIAALKKAQRRIPISSDKTEPSSDTLGDNTAENKPFSVGQHALKSRNTISRNIDPKVSDQAHGAINELAAKLARRYDASKDISDKNVATPSEEIPKPISKNRTFELPKKETSKGLQSENSKSSTDIFDKMKQGPDSGKVLSNSIDNIKHSSDSVTSPSKQTDSVDYKPSVDALQNEFENLNIDKVSDDNMETQSETVLSKDISVDNHGMSKAAFSSALGEESLKHESKIQPDLSDKKASEDIHSETDANLALKNEPNINPDQNTHEPSENDLHRSRDMDIASKTENVTQSEAGTTDETYVDKTPATVEGHDLESLRDEEKLEEKSTPELAPAKVPGLHPPKKVLKKISRKKPTAEVMARHADESQTKILEEALSSHTSINSEEHEVTEPANLQRQNIPKNTRTAGPPRPEKPKNLIGSRPSPFAEAASLQPNFKSSLRVGNATASRIAELQRRLHGGNQDTESQQSQNTVSENVPTRSPSIHTQEPSVSGGYKNVGSNKTPTSSSNLSSQIHNLQEYFENKVTTIESQLKAYITGKSETTTLGTSSNVSGVEDINNLDSSSIGALKPELQNLNQRLDSLALDISKETSSRDVLHKQTSNEIKNMRSMVDSLNLGFEKMESEFKSQKELVAKNSSLVSETKSGLNASTKKLANLESDILSLSKKQETVYTAEEINKLVSAKMESFEQTFATKINALENENRDLKKKLMELRNYIDELVVEEQ
ncbi:hypothetical protein BB558_000050 [Smittium angustum]|uniref:SH3 domain-containing protein n=1 Tax=Smittium angustum TaxID=133377 RepID=A0A2U1JF69_SMIAN|nr:hypothetical protein BB558_000050 [Smittium angustum]